MYLVRPIITSLFFTTLLLAPAVHAQTPAAGGITVDPLLMDLQLDQGKSYDRQITVKNPSQVAYDISFEAFDVEIAPDTHNVKFLAAESKRNTQKSLASWVNPGGKTTFSLQPGQSQLFPFSIVLPQGLAAGDYYGSLNFYYQPQTIQPGSGRVQVRQSIGSLLLVSVDGKSSSVGPGKDYTISPVSLSTRGDVTEVRVDFSNNTLRYVRLLPVVIVEDDAGKVYFQKEGLTKRVFPGEKASVLHSFPTSVLAAADHLQLQYTLRDKDGQQQYYQEKVDLASLQASYLPASLFLTRYKTILEGGALLIVVLLSLAYRRKSGTQKRRR